MTQEDLNMIDHLREEIIGCLDYLQEAVADTQIALHLGGKISTPLGLSRRAGEAVMDLRGFVRQYNALIAKQEAEKRGEAAR